MSDALHWLWLANLRGVGCVTSLKYLRAFNTVTELYDAGPSELSAVEDSTKAEVRLLSDKNLKRAKEILEECQRRSIRVLPMDDRDYPTWLRSIYDPPTVLYVRGSLPNMEEKVGVALVGTRKATRYGLDCAESFAAALARAGAVVVSGLADGVDSAGIAAAIKAGGTVIGVLGTGVDRAYPQWNAQLHRQTAANGALVSEYPPGTPTSRGSFPARNRIIAGLSRAVLVVEAPMKSGALITAARALEEGREVFAIPGRIDDINYKGSNALLRDGAMIALEPEDVIAGVNALIPGKLTSAGQDSKPVLTIRTGSDRQDITKKVVDNPESIEYIDLKEQLGQLSDNEIRVMAALLRERRSAAELSMELGMDTYEVSAVLTILEIGGYVRTEDDNRYGPTMAVVQRNGE